MNIKKIKGLIKGELKSKGISEFDHTEWYVNYEMAELLFDWGFNMPCEIYFHNVSDYEEYGEGTPEYSEWLDREDNWEMCGRGKFLNYPDNFVIRYRYARPNYIQVLNWFQKKFNAKIDITPTKISVKNLYIPHGSDKHYVESWDFIVDGIPNESPTYLAGLTMTMIMDRFKLLAGPFKVKEVIKEIE